MIKCALQYFLEIKSNVGFRGEGKTGVPGEKPLGAKKRTNKLSPLMTPSLGIEPGPHWWEANALTLCQPCSLILKKILRRFGENRTYRPLKILHQHPDLKNYLEHCMSINRRSYIEFSLSSCRVFHSHILFSYLNNFFKKVMTYLL